MRHNEIARVCRQLVADALNLESEYDVPVVPWDHVIYDFASDYEWVIGVSEVENAFCLWLHRTIDMSCNMSCN